MEIRIENTKTPGVKVTENLGFGKLGYLGHTNRILRKMPLDKRVPTAKDVEPYVLDNSFLFSFIECRSLYLSQNVYNRI